MLTRLKEAASLDPLLESIVHQSDPPDEVVVFDAGSSDDTVPLRTWQPPPLTQVRVIVKLGASIAQGRNAAIETSV